MKVYVICEKCGNTVELKPETDGNHAYVHSNFIEHDFYVGDVDIECSSSDNIEEISDFDDISIDKELKELRFDCQKCGNDYIILTEFGG